MFQFPRRGYSTVAESLTGDASEDKWSRWCGGVISATIPAVIGLMSILYQSAYFIGGRPTRIVRYDGTDAIALGAACLAIGLFMHGHYFWSGSNRYYFVSQILKPAGILGVAIAFGYVVVNQVLFH